MRPAEFYAAQIRLGVTLPIIAEILGVTRRRVSRYFERDRHLDVPEHIAGTMSYLESTHDIAVAQIVDHYADGDAVPLTFDPAWWRAHAPAEVAGWGKRAQTLIIADAAAQLRKPIEWGAF